MFSTLSKNAADTGLNWSEAALLLFATLIVIGLIGEYRKEERWKAWSKGFEFLVILGVAGEVIFDGLIFGFSGRLQVIQDAAVASAISEAGKATDRAGVAIKSAADTEKENKILDGNIKTLEGKNLDQARHIIDLEIQFGIRVPKVEEQVGNLQTEIKKSVDRERPQEIDIGDLRKATRGLRRGLRHITLIRLNDPIAGQYATNLGRALRKLKFEVSFIDLPGSRFRGVIVCENGAGDIKVGEALKRAVIVSEIKKITAEECAQPIPAKAPQGLFSFWVPNPKPAGTLIFVGHRRLAPPN